MFTNIILGTLIFSTVKAAWGFWNLNSDEDVELNNNTFDESSEQTSYKEIPTGTNSDSTKENESHKQNTETSNIEPQKSDNTDFTKSNIKITDYKINRIFCRIINAISRAKENSVNEIIDDVNSLKKYYLTNYINGVNDEKDIVKYVNQLISDLCAYIDTVSTEDKHKELFTHTKPDVLKEKIGKLNQFFTYILSPKDEQTLLHSYLRNIYTTKESLNEFADSIANGFYPILYADNNTFDEIVKEKERYQIPTYYPILNYQTLLGMAGELYDKLHTAYFQCGLIPSKYFFSNELVYEIAEKIIERSNFYFCHNLTINQLAHDIADSIIDYIHNSLAAEQIVSKELTIQYLVKRYLGTRAIGNYYYYLKMCAKIYESAIKRGIYNTQCVQMDGNENYIFSNDSTSFKIAISYISKAKGFHDNDRYSIDILIEIVQQTHKYNYSFLYGLRDDVIMRDILLTFYSRENTYNRECE